MIRPDSDGRAPWAPWATHDLVRLIAFVATGAVGCAVAWTGASAHAALRDQTGWIVLGVAAFGVAVVGQSLWLRQGRRAVAAHATRVLGEAAALAPEGWRAATVQAAAVAAEAELLVAAEGLRRFHRSDCLIAGGRGWSPLPRRTHEAAGRAPCGICRP